jgi:FAD linked oxidases, C-terminal domain
MERVRVLSSLVICLLHELICDLFLSSFLGTGELGVGIGKKEYLVKELGEGTVQLMKTIKKAIDPLGIFNPGKVCAIFKTHPFFLRSSVIW